VFIDKDDPMLIPEMPSQFTRRNDTADAPAKDDYCFFFTHDEQRNLQNKSGKVDCVFLWERVGVRDDGIQLYPLLIL
jgi:hypothetical protein